MLHAARCRLLPSHRPASAGQSKLQIALLQAELLRKVLECWTAELRHPPDEATFRKLAHFMEVQQAFSWLQIVEVVRQALGDAFTLQLCEHLLLRWGLAGRPQGRGSASGLGSFAGMGRVWAPLTWSAALMRQTAYAVLCRS